MWGVSKKGAEGHSIGDAELLGAVLCELGEVESECVAEFTGYDGSDEGLLGDEDVPAFSVATDVI